MRRSSSLGSAILSALLVGGVGLIAAGVWAQSSPSPVAPSRTVRVQLPAGESRLELAGGWAMVRDAAGATVSRTRVG